MFNGFAFDMLRHMRNPEPNIGDIWAYKAWKNCGVFLPLTGLVRINQKIILYSFNNFFLPLCLFDLKMLVFSYFLRILTMFSNFRFGKTFRKIRIFNKSASNSKITPNIFLFNNLKLFKFNSNISENLMPNIFFCWS